MSDTPTQILYVDPDKGFFLKKEAEEEGSILELYEYQVSRGFGTPRHSKIAPDY